jgi:hypothetical protein
VGGLAGRHIKQRLAELPQILEVRFAAGPGNAGTCNETHIKRVAIPTEVRPQEEETKNQLLDQAAAMATLYPMAAARRAAAWTKRKSDGINQGNLPHES